MQDTLVQVEERTGQAPEVLSFMAILCTHLLPGAITNTDTAPSVVVLLQHTLRAGHWMGCCFCGAYDMHCCSLASQSAACLHGSRAGILLSCPLNPVAHCCCCCCHQVGTITSPALVKALFDIYVGPDPVSTDAKKSIGMGLAALLNE